MGNVNNVTLIGRLGADPERITTRAGSTMARFSLATNSGTGDHERVDWHRVVCFDKTAENVLKHCAKGDLVFVAGRIEYSRVESDAGVRWFTDIRGWRVSGLARPGQRAGLGASDDGAAEASPAEAMRDGFAEEAIPF